MVVVDGILWLSVQVGENTCNLNETIQTEKYALPEPVSVEKFGAWPPRLMPQYNYKPKVGKRAERSRAEETRSAW